MTDPMTAHAANQPHELAGVESRGAGNVRTLTCAELGARSVMSRYDRCSMRVMIANAVPWSFTLQQHYVAKFPPESLLGVHGSTELSVNSGLRHDDQRRRPRWAGRNSDV